jgi:hypothetical protein
MFSGIDSAIGGTGEALERGDQREQLGKEESAPIRPERTWIKSGSCNFSSTNNVESAFPTRVWEEMHQNVAHPRELVTDSCLFKLSISGIE